MAATLSTLKLPQLPLFSHSKSSLKFNPFLNNLNPNINTPLSNLTHIHNTPLKLTPIKQQQKQENIFDPLKTCSFTLALPFLLHSQDALAVEGQFGILEGRSVALIHPIVMGGLFVCTLYAGYLGWQWRRIRTLQNEINELKKQVKPVAVIPEGSPSDNAAPSPIESKINQLTEERKELLKGNFRDRHFNAGSILLGFGVFEAVNGGVNTWFRTGKLFPGPHLFVGAAITVLWAASAALVPAMQKGNETARSLHIALNTLNVILFLWQIPTGIEIVFKVFEFTNWP